MKRSQFSHSQVSISSSTLHYSQYKNSTLDFQKLILLISAFDNSFSKPSNQRLVVDELNIIKSDAYKNIIQNARNFLLEGNKEAYGRIKKSLPAVTFSGLFRNERKAAALVEYTQLVVLDVDHIHQPEVIKTTLISDKFIYAAWISPSGAGLKILIRLSTSVDEHKIAFDSLVKYFLETYDLNVDVSGSDITRLCFTSHDPQIYINDESSNYKPSLVEYPVPVLKKPIKSNSNKKPDTQNDRRSLFDTYQKNKQSDRNSIAEIIRYLEKNKKSITFNYEHWYKVGLAIANTFTYPVGLKYYLTLCRLDEDQHSEEKSISMLEYCYRNKKLNAISFSTIVFFAREQGFKK